MKNIMHSFLVSILGVYFVLTPVIFAYTPETELVVLLNLFNEAFDTVVWEDEATSGHRWEFTTTDITDSSFNQTNPCGSSSDQSWQGITCSSSPSSCGDNSPVPCNIISLDLDSFNLTGTMINDIDQLFYLTKLIFSTNHFYGTIPPNVGNLSNLKVLKLHQNNLYGSIPSTIGQLNALTLFYVTSNALSQTIPSELGKLSNMEKLYLQKNHFIGSLHENLFNMEKLSILLLHENFFTSTIPSTFTKLIALSKFQINENLLNGTLSPLWGNLANKLVAFSAKDNLLSGSIPDEFGSLKKLTKLDLGTNQLNHELPSTLSKLTKLKELNLANNDFNGSLPIDYSRLTKVTSFHVKYNSLTGPIPNELCELVLLKELDLQDNSFNGTIPSVFSVLTNLLELDMVNNSLTGTIPQEFSTLTQLTLLSMGYNSLESTLPKEISQCISLQELKISANAQMTGTIPPEYGDLTNLITLHLSKTQYNGTIPSSFGKLTNMQVLLLYTNQLQGTIPPELGQLMDARRISLNGNRLTSSIPYELAMNLHMLTVLTLHDNSLTGSIPDSFSNLTSLEGLYLYNNKFTGSLSSSILSQWRELGQLDIGGNSFDGTIPSVLGELTNLQFLRTGYNLFSGTIPETLTKLSNMILVEFQNSLLEGEIPHNFTTMESIDFFHFENNAFSGSLPLFSENASSFTSIKLFENDFTGTIPESYCQLNNLIRLVLSYNSLTGTLPSNFSKLEKLNVLSVKYNYLSGTVPSEYSKLTALRGLVLGTNGFTGSLDHLFFDETNFIIDHLDLSDNLFTGTIPAALFQLPLSVLAFSINCFDGVLPGEICQATDTLVVLSGDGLGASSRCTSFFKTPYFGITLFNGLGGTIPPCLFESEKLEMLHLSGNGLVGSLGEMSNQSVMNDLSLGHNRIRGTIPSSLQRNVFSVLDLSYNDISGTYTEGKGINESEIILEVNRLSGNLNTEGLETVNVLNILKGNFFSCEDVPSNDEYYDDFSCGSSNYDNSLYFLSTAIFIALCLFVWFAIMYRGSTGRSSDVEEMSYLKRVVAMTHNFSYYLSFVTWSSPVRKSDRGPLDKIAAFCDDLRLMTKCIFGIALVSFFLFLPVYLLKTIDKKHSSHEHQYTYLMSVTYATGEVSAALVIMAWTCIIILFCGIAHTLDKANATTSKDPNTRRRNISIADPARKRGLSMLEQQKRRRSTLNNSTQIITKNRSRTISGDEVTEKRNRSRTLSSGSNGSGEGIDYDAVAPNVRQRVNTLDNNLEHKEWSKTLGEAYVDFEDDGDDESATLLEIGKAVLILLVNLLIVGAVNSWYLQFTLGDISPTERLIVQLAMAIFKSIFAVAGVPVLASSIVNTERNILLRLLMAIFNTLLIPLAVTAFTSSSCLENAFKEAPPIETYYQYTGCLNDYLHVKEDVPYYVTCGYDDDEYVMLDVELQPFIPPFTYSYQCSSALLTAYIPVLIFVAAFQMLLPFGFVWFQIMVKYTFIPAPLRFAFYGVIWPDHWLASYSLVYDEDDANREPNEILILDTNDIVYADILNQLIVLLSFGLCSPMLAAAVSLAFGFKMLMWRMLLGRFVHYRMRLSNMKRENETQKDFISIEYDVNIKDLAIDALADATVDFVSVFEMCLWPLLMSSAIFFAIICWDIAGDDVGTEASMWVPILVGCIPLCLWASFVFYKKRIVKKKARNAVLAANLARQLGDSHGEKGRGVSDDIEMTAVVENPISIMAMKDEFRISSSNSSKSNAVY